MFVILTYDINSKRVGKVMKCCKKYLFRVQNSVFEGNISQSKLNKLKNELYKLINTSYDSVRIYEFNYTDYASVEKIGISVSDDFII